MSNNLVFHAFAIKVENDEIFWQVHRARAEREILDLLDHPFLPALYASFQVEKICLRIFYMRVYKSQVTDVIMFNLQTKTHICLITDYYPGGELFMLLDRQPRKVLKEDAVRYKFSYIDKISIFFFPAKS